MIRALRLFNGRVLVRRPLRALVAAVAVASGVALTVMILVVSASIDRSIERAARDLAGPADLRVVGPVSEGGVTPATARRLAGAPGIAAAVPLVRDVSWLARPDERDPVMVVGVPCDLATLAGFSTCGDRAGAAAVSPRTAALLGEDGFLRTHLGYARLTRPVTVAELATFNRGLVVMLPLETASEAFGRQGNVDAVLVDLADGADPSIARSRLTELAGPGHAVEPASSPPAEAAGADAFLPIFSLMAIFALGVGAVLVYNTVTLTIEERRRQLAIASALGAPPSLLAGGLVAEAAAVGALGGAIGAVAGALFARPVAAIIGSGAEQTLGIEVTTFVPASVVVAAVAIGVAVAVAASALPVRRALRGSVAAEISQRDLRSESLPVSRVRVGIVAAALAVGALVPVSVIRSAGALEPWHPAVAIFAFLTTALTTIIAAGFLATGVVALLARLVPRRFVLARMAVRNLLRAPARTGVTACAVAAAIAVALTTASFTASVREGITRNITAGFRERASMEVWAAGVNGVIPGETIERIRSFPGVARVDLGRAIRAQTSAGAVRVIAFDHDTLPFPVFEGSKDTARFDDGAALVTPSLARRGIDVGDTITLRGTRRTVEVPVLGIWQDGTTAGDPVRVPMGTYLDAFGPTSPVGAAITPERGVTVEELAAALTEAELDADAEVRTPQQSIAAVNESLAGQFAGFWAMQRALALIAAIAVLATTMLTIIQRRRELAMLVAVGTAPQDLGLVLLLEAAAIGITGVVIGPVAGIVLFQGIRELAPLIVGFHNPFVLEPSALLVWSPIAVALVVTAAAWPALRATRLDVVESLRWE